ncbi:MAG: flippase-like domain-containing protein [Lachnospiraceae bacterium]|jgi:hypothetical protein|nr:flippase-like domain-containing protein [Lachnospiraceae bacterium]
MDRKKIAWAVISLLLAGLTVYAITSRSQEFSVAMMRKFVVEAKKGWLIMAFISMFGFIFFEGMALVRVGRRLGYRRSVLQGVEYGAADVYFSAITPSATGGQPASAYFMLKDKMPGSAVTASLLINLVMYTAALLFLGACAIVFGFPIFLEFSLVSKVFIGVGCLVLLGFGIMFYLLLRKIELSARIANWFLHLLERMHMVKRAKKRREKLEHTMQEFGECSQIILGKGHILLELFFWNVMQRLAQLAVSMFLFLATGRSITDAIRVLMIQCFVALGSNCAPIPGAMGVADYMMIDGLGQVLMKNEIVNMELLCRGVTFYGSVVCGLMIVIIGYIRRKVKEH